jgi:REP element-mobilizing transposase RayT
MREKYLEAFDRVWIDCLNGDKYKTGKLTPEGEPDPSIFSTEWNPEGIQVGTAIALLVRSAASAAAGQRDAGVTRNAAVPAAPQFRRENVSLRGRGYLPHWELEGATYFVTFRLADSLPKSVLDAFEFERQDVIKTAEQQGRKLTRSEQMRLDELYSERIEAALDAGTGACHLAKPGIAEIVAGALRHFDGRRYNLLAWCVMPNHIHAVFQPLHGHALADILHSWKSFTAKEANKVLQAKGQFWEREYYDHLIRDAQEFDRVIRYVVENPKKAGLESWPWVETRAADRSAAVLAAAGQRDTGVTRSAAVPAAGRGGSAAVPAAGRQDAGATLRFRNLWGKTKRAQLLETAEQDGRSLYQQLEPPLALGLPFMPAQVNRGYFAWPVLPDLFPEFFAGVQSKRDELVIDVDRERLIERIREYFDPEISHEEMKRLCPRAMQPTARFEAKPVRDYLLKRGFLPQNIVRHCYRPFDLRWIYYEPETRLLGEKSPEYFPHVFDGNIWLVSQQKPRREWSRPQFIRSIGCLDLMDRGASCIPLFLKPIDDKPLLASHKPKDARILPSGTRLNISDSLVAYLMHAATMDDAASAFYHTVAILHAPDYRKENSGALRQDWPRIPLPDSKELLVASAELGKRIAALLDTETPFDAAVAPLYERRPNMPPVIDRRYIQKIAVPSRVGGGELREKDEDGFKSELAVTAGWGHAGKGGVTMPGKGKIVERDYTAAERASNVAPPSRRQAGKMPALLGDRTCDVYLNDVAYWSNIPIRVWEYTIGGYQVIKKWLSYREEKLLGRPLSKDEVRYVQEMARRIAAILLLEPTLDANYRAVKEHAYPWK